MSFKKEPNLLITTSILDSFNWLKSCPPSWKERAHNGLIANIRREGWDPHPSAKRGNEFEDAVFRASKMYATGGSEKFAQVVDICKGGKFQQVIKKTIEINGRDVLLYGKVDVLFPERIIDLKSTENYRGASKYLDGWQHKIYLFVTGMRNFTYLVTLFEEYPSKTIVDNYDINFDCDSPHSLEKEIKEGILEFYDWMTDNNLFEDYDLIFSNNRKR